MIVLAGANLVKHIDETLLQRFDRELEIPLPIRRGRKAFLSHELLGKSFSQAAEAGINSAAGGSAG